MQDYIEIDVATSTDLSLNMLAKILHIMVRYCPD